MEMRCSDQPTGQAQLSNFISPFLHAHQALFAASAGRAKHEPSSTWPCLRFNNKCVCGATHLSAHACKEPSGARTESVALAVFPGKGHLSKYGIKRTDDSCEAQQASAIAIGAALLQSGQHCSMPLLPSKKALCEELGSISQYSSQGLAAVRAEEDTSRWCTFLPDTGDCQCMFCARQCQLATGRPSPISSSASTGWWWCELTLSTCMSATARSKVRPRCLTVAAGPAFDMLRAVQEDCPYGTVNEVAGSPLPEKRANVSLRGGMLDSAHVG